MYPSSGVGASAPVNFKIWLRSTSEVGSDHSDSQDINTYEEMHALPRSSGYLPVKRELPSPTPGHLGGPRSLIVAADLKPCITRVEGNVAVPLHQDEAAQPDDEPRSDWWYKKGIFGDNVTRLRREEPDEDVDVDVDVDDAQAPPSARSCADCGAPCSDGAQQLRHRCRRVYKCVRAVLGKGGGPCGWQGRSLLLLRAHELQEHTKPHVCGACNGRFASARSLRSHVAMHAAASSTHCCGRCGARFSMARMLTIHLKWCAGRPTPSPPPPPPPALGPDTKPFLCKLCLATFVKHEEVERHVRAAHTLRHAFKCNVCVSSFRTRCALRTHAKVHSVPRPFTCSVCFARFSQREALMKHLLVHLAPPVKREVGGG